jgi:hypothetical protein
MRQLTAMISSYIATINATTTISQNTTQHELTKEQVTQERKLELDTSQYIHQSKTQTTVEQIHKIPNELISNNRSIPKLFITNRPKRITNRPKKYPRKTVTIIKIQIWN